MAKFETYGVQYSTYDTLNKKTTRTINDLLPAIPNAAIEDNGSEAATKIDNFMRALIAMSTNTYDEVILIGKANVINLMEEG